MTLCLRGNIITMCGRKTLTKDMQSIIEELAIEEWENPDNYIPNYNIAPTQKSPILIDKGKRVVKSMRWGLIPSWSKDDKFGARMINARIETLTEKPLFFSSFSPSKKTPNRNCFRLGVHPYFLVPNDMFSDPCHAQVKEHNPLGSVLTPGLKIRLQRRDRS